MSNVSPKWTLGEGVELCRQLQVKLGDHAHFALGGGTLMRGWSDNDLDIMVYNHSSDPLPEDIADKIANAMGWKLEGRRTSEYESYVHTALILGGRRVEIFFVEKVCVQPTQPTS